MAFVLTQLEVQEFDAWKQVFDSDGGVLDKVSQNVTVRTQPAVIELAESERY